MTKNIFAVNFILLLSLTGMAGPTEKPKTVFDPAQVTEISWTADNETVRLKNENKDHGKQSWQKVTGPKDFKPDDWGIHRRLVLLSNLHDSEAVELTGKILGKIQFKLGSKSASAEFNDQGFRWLNQDDQGNGYLFSKHPELKELFDEGIKSIAIHELNICDPEKVTELGFVAARWSLKKNNGKWILIDEKEQNPTRLNAISEFLKHFCHVKVDHFFPKTKMPSGSALLMRIFEGKKNKNLNQIPGDKFILTDSPPFASKIFQELIKVSPDDFKDPSLGDGRVALDPAKPQDERIKAIRNMKDSRSPEGIPALKMLINEKTEIDLYRYEAVDALASIGTKEAYKVIADRLAEIGRSGFELRLARALALGMGHNFVSDEKTPEPQRRAEVQDLLAYYRKNPPGK